MHFEEVPQEARLNTPLKETGPHLPDPNLTMKQGPETKEQTGWNFYYSFLP